jgi:hypothetical protein
MSRTFLFATCLLVLASAVHAVNPARESANGGGGVCPEAVAQAAAGHDASAVPATTDAVSQATPAPAATPTPAKRNAVARPRGGTRWHSFVPGMFK